MPAVSKGDGMRGLAVFISDIRNCKWLYFDLLTDMFHLIPTAQVYTSVVWFYGDSVK